MKKNYLETLYPTWGQQFVMDEVLFEVDTGHQHLIIFNFISGSNHFFISFNIEK